MKKFLMGLIVVSIALVGCQSDSDSASDAGEDYPNKSIEMIVPYSAGGGTDTFARIAGKTIEEQLGESLVIVNKPGSSGEVGTTDMKEAEADGYNLGLISLLDYILMPNLKETTYGFEDFKYVASFTESGTVIVGGKNEEFDTLEDLVDYAKDHPGELSASISGEGHTYVLMQLEKEADIDITPVMYSGGGESLNAVIGGHVDIAIISQSFVQQTEDQGLKTLAISTEERVDSLDHVPTIIEEGYDVQSADSRVLVAPKDIPDDVYDKLISEIDEVGVNEELMEKAEKGGFEFKYRSEEDLEDFIQSAMDRVEETVKGNEDEFEED